MERTCHKCNHSPQKKDIYCRKCGAKLPPHSLSYATIILLVEIIVLLAVLLGGVSLLSHIASPKTTLKQYYNGLIEGDYVQAYSRVFKEGEFQEAQDFANAVKSYPYSGLDIQEISISDKEKEGNITGKVVLKDHKNQVEYVEEVSLTKAGSIGGFWTRWRVTPNFILQNYQIETPLETKLYLNEKLLNKENSLVEETEQGIRYTIPNLYDGKYKLKLESKLYVEVERVLDTKENKSFMMSELQIKPETKELLQDQSKRDFEYLWQSIYDKVNYEETRFPKEDSSLKEEYKKMMRNRIPHGYRNVECVAYADYLFNQTFLVDQNALKAKVTVDALRAFSGRYFYFGIIPTDKLEKDTCAITFIYTHNKGNGKWELEAFYQG